MQHNAVPLTIMLQNPLPPLAPPEAIAAHPVAPALPRRRRGARLRSWLGRQRALLLQTVKDGVQIVYGGIMVLTALNVLQSAAERLMPAPAFHQLDVE